MVEEIEELFHRNIMYLFFQIPPMSDKRSDMGGIWKNRYIISVCISSSTTTTALILHCGINKILCMSADMANIIIIIISLDFTKAFNTVCQSANLANRRWNNVDCVFFSWPPSSMIRGGAIPLSVLWYQRQFYTGIQQTGFIGIHRQRIGHTLHRQSTKRDYDICWQHLSSLVQWETR